MNKAIGGYFGLELPDLERARYQGAMYFQSARACFYALLQKCKPSKVWLPYFNCDAFLNVLIASGVECSFYSITEDFLVEEDIQLREGEWLVYVNYFGVCEAQCDAVIRRFGSGQVLLDHAQAYFCPPKDCLATIYSPRKFFGVPDGGILVSRLSVDHCSSSGSNSYERTLHLLKRFADTAESGYSDYQSAERTLEDFDLSEMSSLSKKLLSNADADTVIEQRNRNFTALHERLKSFNKLDFDLSSLRGPLCYPFLNSAGSTLRKELLSESIYSAVYWAECQSRCAPTSREFDLSSLLLPLPCDQRYGREEMNKIVDVIIRGLKIE